MCTLLQSAEKKLKSPIDWIARVWTIGTILIVLLNHFNWIPGYQIVRYRSDSISPYISLFPGEQIQLDFSFHDTTPRSAVTSADWRISQNSQILFEKNELNPTVTLPLTNGGIYQLMLTAITDDGTIKKGQTNINVAQVSPIIVRSPTPNQLLLTSQNTTNVLLNKIKSNGVELYAGNNEWINPKSMATLGGGVVIQLQQNQNIALFNNKILFRTKESENYLSSYGSAYYSTGVNSNK